jgi:hypothetical protein
MSFIMERLIQREGEVVQIRRRTASVDSNGYVNYTYPETIETKMVFISTGGYEEIWYPVGFHTDIDFIGIANPKDSIDVGDIVIRPDFEEYEVREKNPRRVGRNLSFWECQLRRVHG